MAENTAAGENIGDPVVATDDRQRRTQLRAERRRSRVFDIVPTPANCKTKATLDHEAEDSYTVTVTATDPSDESDSIDVTITVTDENEPPPAPAIPTVEAAETNGHNTLDVSWEAPDNSGRPSHQRL